MMVVGRRAHVSQKACSPGILMWETCPGQPGALAGRPKQGAGSLGKQQPVKNHAPSWELILQATPTPTPGLWGIQEWTEAERLPGCHAPELRLSPSPSQAEA